MKREIVPQSKGKLCVTILIPLGTKDSERAKKLDDELLQKQLNELARDAHCEYAVRLNGDTATAEIAFTHQGAITDQDEHDYEIKAINFMTEVDKMEFQKPEPECPSHESDEEEITVKQFVERLLHDLELPKEDTDHVVGAQVLCIGPKSLPFPLPWGKIGYNTLKEMCELYLKAHKNDDITTN